VVVFRIKQYKYLPCFENRLKLKIKANKEIPKMLIYDTAPCKDCQKRTMACHSSCKDYKDWKADHDNRKAEIVEKERVEYQLRAAKIEFVTEYKKCKRRKN
jgi:hypothetical protein